MRVTHNKEEGNFELSASTLKPGSRIVNLPVEVMRTELWREYGVLSRAAKDLSKIASRVDFNQIYPVSQNGICDHALFKKPEYYDSLFAREGSAHDAAYALFSKSLDKILILLLSEHQDINLDVNFVRCFSFDYKNAFCRKLLSCASSEALSYHERKKLIGLALNLNSPLGQIFTSPYNRLLFDVALMKLRDKYQTFIRGEKGEGYLARLLNGCQLSQKELREYSKYKAEICDAILKLANKKSSLLQSILFLDDCLNNSEIKAVFSFQVGWVSQIWNRENQFSRILDSKNTLLDKVPNGPGNALFL